MDAVRPVFDPPAKRVKPWNLTTHARRRWFIKRARPAWADRGATRALYAEAKRFTHETGVKHHVDHIYPIISDTICGLHVPANLRIVTATVNCAKSNRWEEVL